MPSGQIAVVMVGLPACGKTFIARNLARYLRWSSIPTLTISVAHIRKTVIGLKLRASFFDPQNSEALLERTRIADMALEMMLEWFKGGKEQVGILDASNTTVQRRDIIRNRFEDRGIKVVFLECIYNLESAVEAHIRELRMACPEYEDLTGQEALDDFKVFFLDSALF
jgi:predicted kinase